MTDTKIITAGDLTVEIDPSGFPVGDIDLPVKKISVYQCGSDWQVVACHGGWEFSMSELHQPPGTEDGAETTIEVTDVAAN